jgi:hypothetical protein
VGLSSVLTPVRCAQVETSHSNRRDLT